MRRRDALYLDICRDWLLQAVFQMGDKDKDDYIDRREFLNYCVEHEKKLWLVFQAMDVNKDGRYSHVFIIELQLTLTISVNLFGQSTNQC